MSAVHRLTITRHRQPLTSGIYADASSACLRSSNQTSRTGIRQALGAPLGGLQTPLCHVLVAELPLHAAFVPV